MIMSGDLICEKKASPCEASENRLTQGAQWIQGSLEPLLGMRLRILK